MGTLVLDTPKLKIEAESSSDRLTLRPMGTIDEDFDITTILHLVQNSDPPAKTVCFDLSRVSRINSVGVREWITLMSKLLSLVSCEFVHVNEIFMEQSSMIPTILGDATSKLLSFDVPYYCEAKCKTRSMVTLEPKDITHSGGMQEAPPQSCSKCGETLTLDFAVLGDKA
jgi:ABC-type transporter Mla MlaB component